MPAQGGTPQSWCGEIPACCSRAEPSPSPAMLGTLMTALFFVVRAVRQVSLGPRNIYCCTALLSCSLMGQAEQFLAPLGMASVPPKPPGQEGGGLSGVPGEGCDLC